MRAVQQKVCDADDQELDTLLFFVLSVLLSAYLSAFFPIPPYTMMLAALAILGHLSAASFATGPRISEPFISPSGVITMAALSSN
jgi:hypothetical protein